MDGPRAGGNALDTFKRGLFAVIANPTRGLEQIGIRLCEPLFVAREEVVVPNRRGVAAGVVPRGPAAGGREVPLAVVVDYVEGVLHALARGRHESRDLHGARLEVFAAAPVLAVDCGTVERPEIAARVEFGEDEHVGDR